MPLPRRAFAGGCYDRIEANVYDIQTKEIVFTGSWYEVANHLGITYSHVQMAIKRKNRINKKFAIRIKKDNQ